MKILALILAALALASCGGQTRTVYTPGPTVYVPAPPPVFVPPGHIDIDHDKK